MMSVERPRLIGADVQPFQFEGEQFLRLSNREGLSERWLPLHREAGLVLQYFDGSRTVEEIRQVLLSEYGAYVSDDHLTELVRELDAVFVLDTPNYHSRKREVIEDFRRATVREASHAGGAYPDDPVLLRQELRKMFETPPAPGLPKPGSKLDRRVRGILSPHIDFRRGGPSFTFGYRELLDRTDAATFVIIGTSHYTTERFVLAKKHYRTPLGLAKADFAYIDRIAAAYGREQAFADELATKPEHSIEFQVLFLQYLLEGVREFQIVPVLVGSFYDAIEDRRSPDQLEDVRRMIGALREAEANAHGPVAYIASGDLAHIGMKFGDPWPIDDFRSRWCREADLALLNKMATGKPAALFEAVALDEDARRTCGFPPAYTMLESMGNTEGKLLCYDQFVDPKGFEIVSFASMAFYAQ